MYSADSRSWVVRRDGREAEATELCLSSWIQHLTLVQAVDTDPPFVSEMKLPIEASR